MQDHIPDALITAFERQYDSSWNDPQLRNGRLAMRYGWAAAMEAKQCLHQIQEPASNHSEIPSSSEMSNNCAAAVAVPDGLRATLIDVIAQGLSGTWHCNRVWEAWHVGTMSQEDFSPVDESDTPTELADAVLAALAATPAEAPENVREGTPYDNPAFERLARELGVWGTAQSAVCAQFWLAATPAADDLFVAAEIGALRDVYEQARGVLRYDGIDQQRAIRYRDGLIEAIETVKTIDGGNWEPPAAAAPVVLPEPAMNEEGYLPCPFCGSDQVSLSTGEQADGEPWYYVECESCAATSDPEKWNERALLATGGQAQAEVSSALKPCPFCGGAAHFDVDEDNWEWVECSNCGMQGNRSASLMEDCKPKLIEAWNRRTPTPQAQADARDALPMVAYLCIEDSGVIDFEVIPPCTLPPGEYSLYAKNRAAIAAAKGE